MLLLFLNKTNEYFCRILSNLRGEISAKKRGSKIGPKTSDLAAQELDDVKSKIGGTISA